MSILTQGVPIDDNIEQHRNQYSKNDRLDATDSFK